MLPPATADLCQYVVVIPIPQLSHVVVLCLAGRGEIPLRIRTVVEARDGVPDHDGGFGRDDDDQDENGGREGPDVVVVVASTGAHDGGEDGLCG